uniref:Uncharacterized protein n=1 Tax=viral metagenome TaxID=1070528 RepID=A0A6C0D708_9ZZZZ
MKKQVGWKDIVEWKWTNGEKCERSQRRTQSENYDNKKIETELDKLENIAFQQALLSENDIWSLEEQQVFASFEKPKSNRREETYNRMAGREMVGQIGMNPFVQRNYLDDVMTQDNYLKPISTSLEREKENG